MILSPIRGKELPFIVCAPNKMILQLSTLLDSKKIGAHGRALKVFVERGAEILASYLQAVGENIELVCFLALSDVKNIEDLINQVKGLEGVKELEIYGPYPGITVDDAHFPFTVRRGARMIVFSAERYAQVLARLRELFGSGADLILYEMGKKHGEEMANALQKMAQEAGVDLKPAQLAELMFRYLQSCGWAKFKLNIVSEEPLQATIRAEDFFEALARSEGCNLFKGELTGIFSAIYKLDIKVEEEACKARGAEACVFKVTSRQSP
ncbi:MAG: hypothetical protein DRJ31_09190 [Candidatus Methanomethylicota archaeon]|uniref:4-vinyl reductase 4VR domain-containing protein n=1 Tax=Thermoproteota archaeon TaxID=2056631 RepID=A0A497ELE9_9CREN|nr:MAG: hypothetical protein DRJ31_09190 [Candidatus Verstraetearchaeota archaeon]